MNADTPQEPASIAKLAAALSIAQGKIDAAKKSNENLHFKSKYADLASVWDACRTPLSENGLAVVQLPEVVDGRVAVVTRLIHSSGEEISSRLSVKLAGDGPQAIGSALTYLRRYALMAMVGIAPDEDDGEAAERGTQPAKKAAERRPDPAPAPSAPKPSDAEREELAGLVVKLARELGAAIKDDEQVDTVERAFLGNRAAKLNEAKLAETLPKFRAPSAPLREWAAKKLVSAGLIVTNPGASRPN